MNYQKTSALIAWGVALAGAVIGFAANFIKYLTSSNFFFVWKVSIIELILKSFDDPETMLGTAGDKIVFAIILIGIITSLLLLLFALLRKMTAVIVFAIVSCLPVLMIGDAWIHYAGFLLALVGAIWYKIATRKRL